MHDHDDPPHPLTLEFDGPDAEPDVIDPRSVFEVAARYVDLVRRVAAKTTDAAITLRGFEVRDKCTQIVLHSDAPPDLLASISERVLAISRGEVEIYGTKTAANALSRALEEADPSLRIGQRDMDGELRVIREPVAPAAPLARFHEVDEVRATVVKAGGRNPPRVQLDMPGEPRLRWLVLDSEDVARDLAELLYRQVDVEVRIHREGDGRFISGRVLDYRVAPKATLAELRAWYREHLSHWDEVDDIEAALGRGRDWADDEEGDDGA